ncbi:MAG: class I SAM-dependent RNA methyltransferase [Alphaproteobacteria bacterium]|nr:class I SAM-dependent RNA methyltransferase [Alphaproteobacteria bacterium]
MSKHSPRNAAPRGTSKRSGPRHRGRSGGHQVRERRLPRNTDPITLDIIEIGAKGDGIARPAEAEKPYYVPLAAPGDRLVARPTAETADFIRGEIIELETPSAARQTPPCPHFGPCGGCQLQHIPEETYRRFKSALVEKALSSHGLGDVQVRPMVALAPGTRRRATLFGRTLAAGPILGFHEAASHRIVDIDACPLLTDRLNTVMATLRTRILPLAAGDSRGETLDFTLLDHDNGVDVTIAAPFAPNLAQREALAALAEDLDLARIAWRTGDGPPEPIAARHEALLTLSGVAVMPPPAAFTQAAAPSEAAIVEAVSEALPDMEHAADLYAGIGTLSFAAARKAKAVTAIDGADDAVRALRMAADRAGLGNRVRTETRNLALRPLLTAELAPYDAVLFDPPRAGAKEQATQLAGSSVKTIVAVSCNPQTFARDARILVDGGYRLRWVQPIDQFLWSHHVEVVALLTLDIQGPRG